MKNIIIAILMQFPAVAGEIVFNADDQSPEIKLLGRDRPLWLPFNVYVKEYRYSNDKKTWIILLYQYRDKSVADSDYYSIIMCESNQEDSSWEVKFMLFAPEMTELFGERFRVIELGPVHNPESVILKISETGRADADDPKSGDVFWEKWNLKIGRRIELIKPARTFEPFE